MVIIEIDEDPSQRFTTHGGKNMEYWTALDWEKPQSELEIFPNLSRRNRNLRDGEKIITTNTNFLLAFCCALPYTSIHGSRKASG